MRGLGFALFVIGLIFTILAIVQRYLVDIMVEAKMVPGIEGSIVYFNVAIGASAAVMLVGLVLRLMARAPVKPPAAPNRPPGSKD
jgi:hypothetical protein